MQNNADWPDTLSELPESTPVIIDWGKLSDCPECKETHNPRLVQEYQGTDVEMRFCPECETRIPQDHVRNDPEGNVVSSVK